MGKSEIKGVFKTLTLFREKPGYIKKSKKIIAFYLDVSEKAVERAKAIQRIKSKEDITNITPDIDITLSNRVEVAREIFNNAIKDHVANNRNPLHTLVIADMHEPFCKKGYLEHCMKIRDKYNCGTVVLIGDEVDLCGVSQWEKDPDGFSAGTEAELAQAKMKAWYAAFPTAFVCIGNHTARPFRQAKSNGIPKKFMKTYEEAWEAPSTWKWADSWEINNVHYTHGTGYSGPNAAIRIATRHRQNTVIGHIHSEAGIQYSASKIDLVWGMQVGGALDDTSYAAHYAKDQLKKSIIGCGVVLDNTPIYEPMQL